MTVAVSVPIKLTPCGSCVHRLPEVNELVAINLDYGTYNLPGYYCKLKKRKTCDGLDSADNHVRCHKLIGAFNEIEYSARIYVTNLSVELAKHASFVRKRERYTFNVKRKVFFDDSSLSSEPLSNDNEEIFGEFALRIDKLENDIEELSCKWKIDKTSFCSSGLKINSTKSLEVDLPGMSSGLLKFDETDRGNKNNHSIYWYLGFVYRKDAYRFRVDLRRSVDVERSFYEINVECEDPIPAILFSVIHHFIFLYYREVHLNNNGVLLPISEHVTIDNIDGLHEIQREIGNTLKLLDIETSEKQNESENTESRENVCDFVRYMCLKSYQEYTGKCVPFESIKRVIVDTTDSFKTKETDMGPINESLYSDDILLNDQ